MIWAFGGEAITSYDDVAKHAIGDRASNTINVVSLIFVPFSLTVKPGYSAGKQTLSRWF